MNETQIGTAPPGLKPGDILHVIFRRKWIIIPIAGLGIITAGILYWFYYRDGATGTKTWFDSYVPPKMYGSEAKLLIKYVLEGKSAKQIAVNDSQLKPVDPGEKESLISTEVQVLSSLDLARDVARIITPEKVLEPDSSGPAAPTNTPPTQPDDSQALETAASQIASHLKLDVPRGSSVIQLVLQHPNHRMVQPILKQLIESYFSMHSKVHGSSEELDGFLDRQMHDLSTDLDSTEKDLRVAKANAGIVNLEETKKENATLIARIKSALLDTEAQLAEAKALEPKPVEEQKMVMIPTDELVKYRAICRNVDGLHRHEDELLSTLTPETKLVKDIEVQIATNEWQKYQLEVKYPILVAMKPPGHSPSSTELSQKATVTALEAKSTVLTNQLARLQDEARKLDTQEPDIVGLERKRAVDDSRYKYFAESSYQRKIDAELGGRISNISTIQLPSPYYRMPSKVLKAIVYVLLGSIGGAFALAFATEFYLDSCLKRPMEVEAKLGIPLFVSIPLMHRNGHSRLLGRKRAMPLLTERNNGPSKPDTSPESAHDPNDPWVAAEETATSSGVANGDPASGHSSAFIRPFSDALRDRLINFFETRNMLHKPKLVALTSCKPGAGVSTVAAGLASSLSETGDGNVLLVDLNQEEGSALQFHKGDLACGLEDALKEGKRDGALVQDNLYVVTEGSKGDDMLRAFPKRFKNLMPRLKASDFDYIIFDLPAVNQISITPRLTRFMDYVLLVIESEKTDLEVLKRGIKLLQESQPNVGTVLNRCRSYGPKRLRQEF
jgi:Mrp family chromosome partitioning ATPase/uncharacterized protein involved in exopolysaccharide biosynthesis